MTFTHLGLLAAGLAAVAIPILIHLLMRRRRKPLMWGAMRFLVEAYRRQRRRLMIEQWLLLATRCLLVALLALAIARPMLGALGSAGGRTIILVIDNSIASTAQDAAGTRTALDRHKAAAALVLDEIARSADQTDRVALITTAAPADGLILPASANLAAVRGLIEALEPTDARADLPGALTLIAEHLAQPALAPSTGPSAALPRNDADAPDPERTLVVVISDFAEGVADLDAALPRLPRGVRILASTPVEQAGGNVAIASLEPLRGVVLAEGGAGGSGGGGGGGATQLVRVGLVRSGETSGPAVGAIQLQLTASARPTSFEPGLDAAASAARLAGRAEYRFAPGQQETSVAASLAPTTIPAPIDPAQLPAGSALLTASIDADALSADNTLARPMLTRSALRVGIVGAGAFAPRQTLDALTAGEWLRLALAPDEGGPIEPQSVPASTIDPARLAALEALLITRPDVLAPEQWRAVRDFADAGGLVLITPPSDVNVHLWPDAAAQALGIDWVIPREPETHDPPLAILAPPPNPGADDDEPDLLSAIRPELPDLVPGVLVGRSLAPSPQSRGGGGRALLTLPDGRPLLWVARPGSDRPADASDNPAAANSAGLAAPRPPAPHRAGLIVYLASAPDLTWTGLPAKPLMIPLMQELIRQGVGQARGTSTALAGRPPSAPPRTAALEPLTTPDPSGWPGPPGRVSAQVSGRASPRPIPVTAAGLASEPIRDRALFAAVDARGLARGLLAVNPDWRGGRLTPQPRGQVEPWLAAALTPPSEPVLWIDPDDTSASAPPQAAGGPDAVASWRDLFSAGSAPSISLPLFIAALALALVEAFLARSASHASLPETTKWPGPPGRDSGRVSTTTQGAIPA